MNQDERSEPDTELPTVPRPVDATGKTIAGYRLLQKVGEGGMGVVYEAEQETPVRRRVALKLINTVRVYGSWLPVEQPGAMEALAHGVPVAAPVTDRGPTGSRPFRTSTQPLAPTGTTPRPGARGPQTPG